MAITSHFLIGPSHIDILQGEILPAYGSDGTSDTPGTTVASTANPLVNTNVPGTYTITYTLTEYLNGLPTGATDSSVTRTVTVFEYNDIVDTNFDIGIEYRGGENTSGTHYNDIVDSARAGTPPTHSSAAYHSETALDPYEVSNSVGQGLKVATFIPAPPVPPVPPAGPGAPTGPVAI